jgi:hypothetical protein
VSDLRLAQLAALLQSNSLLTDEIWPRLEQDLFERFKRVDDVDGLKELRMKLDVLADLRGEIESLVNEYTIAEARNGTE